MNPKTQDLLIPQLPNYIDEIVFTPSAREWFTEHNLMPSSWGLDAVEVKRLANSGIALTIFNSPACTIPLGDVRKIVSPLDQVVVLDAKQIDTWIAGNDFTREEIIATCLHEIGHVVNEQEYKFESDEFWADDYARYCRYEGHLLTALQKLHAVETSQPVKSHTQSRIERIQQGKEIKTRW
jgi:hypothetical protein